MRSNPVIELLVGIRIQINPGTLSSEPDPAMIDKDEGPKCGFILKGEKVLSIEESVCNSFGLVKPLN